MSILFSLFSELLIQVAFNTNNQSCLQHVLSPFKEKFVQKGITRTTRKMILYGINRYYNVI